MAKKLSFHFTDARTLRFTSMKEVQLDLGGDAIDLAVTHAIVSGVCERSTRPFKNDDGEEVMLALIVDEGGRQLFCNVDNI